MTFVNDPTDPANMTPEERVAEVAAILAEGVVRLRRRTATPAGAADVPAPQSALESAPNGLDECGGTRPCGHRG
jgi:hypothetical protein